MPSPLLFCTYTTPFGFIEIGHDNDFIVSAKFVTSPSSKPTIESELGQRIKNELAAYSENPKHCFQLPLKPQGSAFQLKVCDALLTIPSGHTQSYGELALTLKSAPRAIGQACKRNPIALFIPCHRVVGKNNLGGFMGMPSALHLKQALLAHEGHQIIDVDVALSTVIASTE